MSKKKKDKKKIEEAMRKARELKRQQIRRALKSTDIQMPKKETFFPYPTEYLTFLEELEQKPVTYYEKACSIAEKYFPIKPNPKTTAKLETYLKAGYINATPKGAYSLTFLVTILALIPLAFLVSIGLDLAFSVFGGILLLTTFWYFYNYPQNTAKSMRVKMPQDNPVLRSSDILVVHFV